MQKVRKLVLPVAGLGKRLRPLTLTIPKNLVPVNGKPLLEYTLEEAAQSGIEEAILIMGPEHRDRFAEYLETTGKKKFPNLRFHIRIQEKPFGNGQAILQASDLLYEPFAIRFPDDIIVGSPPTLSSLIAVFESRQAPVLLLERIPQEQVSRYGVVRAEGVGNSLYRIHDFVEKPAVEEAPSNLIIIGGYVVPPTVIDHLRELEKSAPNVEDGLLLLDALKKEVESGNAFYGYEFSGTRLDCGTLEGLRAAEGFLSKRK